jgi:tetratricopeptide (TPR) repeat protein
VQSEDGIRRAWLPIEKPDGGWHRVWEWEPVPGRGFWPLTPTVFWLEWRLFGADERWAAAPAIEGKIEAVQAIANRFHVPNILLHALCAILVWHVLTRLRVPGAWWAGVVFAVHPINVPSVAWVSELKNTLSLFFVLLSLALYLRHDEHPRPRLYAASLMSYILSLCAKTSAVGFPFVLLGCVAFHHRSVRRLDGLRAAPFFAIALAMGWLTLWFTAQSGGLDELVIAPESFWHRLAQAGWIPLFYAWKTIVPVDLMMIYPRLDVPWRSPGSYGPGLAIVALLCVAWYRRASWGRGVGLVVAITLVLLFPVVGFFDMTYMIHSEVADHLHYASVVPLIVLAVAAVTRLIPLRQPARRVAQMAALSVVALLAGMTFQRAALFKSHLALWTDNVARNPDAWMAQYNLGGVLLLEAEGTPPGSQRDDSLRRSVIHLSSAARLQPRYVFAHYKLGQSLSLQGDDASAIVAWRRAIDVARASQHFDPAFEAMQRVGIARSARRLGQLTLAREEYARSLVLSPERFNVRLELAQLWTQLGDESAARAELERIIEQRPSHFRARILLAMMLASSQNISIRDGDAALEHAERAGPSEIEDPGRRLRKLHALAAAHAQRAWSGSVDRTEGFEEAVRLMIEAEQITRAANNEREHAIALRRLRLYANMRPLRRDSNRP